MSDPLEFRIRPWIKAVDEKARLAFISSLLAGIVCHLLVIVGHYPAYSGLTLFINSGTTQLAEGRWLAALIMYLNGVATLPVLVGIEMLVSYSLASTVLVKTLELKSDFLIVAFSIIFITFPVIAGRNSFLYMSDCYGMAVLFACAGANRWNKARHYKDLIICTIYLAFSFGCYQTDLSVALVVFAIVLFRYNLTGKPIKVILRKAVDAIVVIVIALILYYIIFRLSLVFFSITPTSRTEMHLDFPHIFAGIRKCYSAVKWFLLYNAFYSRPVGRMIVVCTFAVSCLFAVSGILTLLKAEDRWLRILFVGLIVLVMPILACYIFIVVPIQTFQTRLFSAYVFFAELPILLCNSFVSEEANIAEVFSLKKHQIAHCLAGLYHRGLLLLSAVSVCFFFVVSNTAYMSAYLNYEKEYSLALRIVDRIENTPGYHHGMKVGIVNSNDFDIYDGNTSNMLAEYIPMMEQYGNGIMSNVFGLRLFIDQFIRTDMDIINYDFPMRELITEAGQDVVDRMEPFPALNCTTIVDDVLYFYLT